MIICVIYVLFVIVCQMKCFSGIKHSRDIDVSNAMHIGYWMTSLPLTKAAALINFVTVSMRFVYNMYQKIGRLKRKNRLYKKILVEHGLYKLSIGVKYVDNGRYVDNMKPLSKKSLQSRANSFVDLLITQDASVCVAQEFLMFFMSKLYDVSPNIQEHLRQKMMPIIIRDINTSIQDWRNDPMRQTREAFGNKHTNMSVRKSRQTRAHVSM